MLIPLVILNVTALVLLFAVDLRAADAGAFAPLRIACVGDSITEGTVLPDKVNDSWPAVVQKALGSKAVVGNFGRGGATCISAGDTPYAGSPQDLAAIAFAPDVVLIMLGTNDARSANAAARADFARDLAALGHRFALLPNQPLIVLCTPLPAFRANHTVDPDTIAKDLAPAVRRVAAEEDWPLIDIYLTLTALGPTCADGIHPDVAGTAKLAQAILAELNRQKLLKRQPPPSRLAANLAAGKPQHLIVYGTSLTEKGAWVAQITELIGKRHPGLLTVTNSGKSAMSSQWGFEHLDELVIDKKPDTVLIEFGINDAFLDYHLSVPQAEKNLTAMITRIAKARAATEIVLMTMNQPTREHGDKRPHFADYMMMYRRVAKIAKVPLIDLLPAWERLRRRDAAQWDQVVPDGIHPDAAGSALITTPGIFHALFERRAGNASR